LTWSFRPSPPRIFSFLILLDSDGEQWHTPSGGIVPLVQSRPLSGSPSFLFPEGSYYVIGVLAGFQIAVDSASSKLVCDSSLSFFFPPVLLLDYKEFELQLGPERSFQLVLGLTEPPLLFFFFFFFFHQSFAFKEGLLHGEGTPPFPRQVMASPPWILVQVCPFCQLFSFDSVESAPLFFLKPGLRIWWE